MAKNAVTCPGCGVEEAFCADGERPPPLHEIGEFTCDVCGLRAVYGTIQPRIVLEPLIDERHFKWTVLRVQDPKTKEDLVTPIRLDPKLVLRLANNLLSLVVP